MRRPSATTLVVDALAIVTLGVVLLVNPAAPARHLSAVGSHDRHAASTTDDKPGSITTGSAGQAIDPALFNPGACMAFAPTTGAPTTGAAGDRHETVFLDAGHGGVDPGAVGSTESGQSIDEASVNLAIELDTMTMLRAQGYRVIVSRTQNTTVAKLGPGDTSGGLLTAQGRPRSRPPIGGVITWRGKGLDRMAPGLVAYRRPWNRLRR